MGKHLYKEGLRRCYKCKRTLSLTKKYFNYNKNNSKEFAYICRKCRKEYQRNWHKKNRKKYLKYYKKNRIKILKRVKEWREKNPDYQRKWAFAHREQIREWDREWRRKNREKRNLWNTKRRARLKGAEGTYTLEEWKDLKKKFNYQCATCGRKEPKIKLVIDHIIPLSKEGSNYILNIQPLCKNCNSKKGIKIL